jgi:hypothetical protein
LKCTRFVIKLIPIRILNNEIRKNFDFLKIQKTIKKRLMSNKKGYIKPKKASG